MDAGCGLGDLSSPWSLPASKNLHWLPYIMAGELPHLTSATFYKSKQVTWPCLDSQGWRDRLPLWMGGASKSYCKEAQY